MNKEIKVKVDVSNFATSNFTIGGMLLIKYKNEKWRPVVYIFKLLNEAKRNYKIHDKEILAIIWCLEV